ncbi:SWIM zinc finger family protein [Paenibacillaceae bacterium]|nr:SWIM zinc finger family protein [Paenibacillaceae bacterium]
MKRITASYLGISTLEQPARRKIRKTALVKKIAVQLNGIESAEQLVRKLVQAGLGRADKQTLLLMKEQIQQLGNNYIPGIQAVLRELLQALQPSDELEKDYNRALEKLAVIHTLLKKSKSYLQSRKDNPELPPETATNLEEWIGHVWELSELRELGCISKDARMLQLSFRSYRDQIREVIVDEGCWMELHSGHLFKTRNYRPLHAAEHIGAEDSCFEVIETGELIVYPGDLNPRVRWEASVALEAAASDYETVRLQAHTSYPDIIRSIKNQIKNPLADKHPVALLHYAAIKQQDDQYIMMDTKGNHIVCADISAIQQATTPLLPLLGRRDLSDQAMLVMFEHNAVQNRLLAQPLSIVTDKEIIRLLY